MKVTIDPGAIIINVLDLVIERPHFKVFEADLYSKYPGHVSYSIADNALSVLIWADEHTLNIDPELANHPTTIDFEFPDAKDWAVIAEGARYTVRIVLWNNTYRTVSEYRSMFNRHHPQNFTGPEADRIRNFFDRKEVDELYQQGLGESLEQMRRGEGIDIDPQELRRRTELEISEEDAEMLRKSEPAPLVIKVPGIVIEDE